MSELDKKIASYLVHVQPGEPLLNIRQLADQYDVSVGSISTCLTRLTELGAITLIRRGRLGTILEHKSLNMLWKFVSNSPMVIALTLPSYPKCEGLATALYHILNNTGIETYLTFIRGSYNRLKALKSGLCNAIVVSVLSADELSSSEEVVLLRLPAQTFVTDHCVLTKKHASLGDEPLMVGIDHDSFDIRYLTELEFENLNVRYAPIPYTQTDLNFEKSSIDAVLSNSDHLRGLNHKIISRPLSPRVQSIVGERDTAAAILVRANDSATQAVLEEYLEVSKIIEIQDAVVNGLMIPRY